MKLRLTHPSAPIDPRAEAMMPAVGGFPPSDRPLFLSGYGELCRIDLNGGRALEICGGSGKLAAGLARQFPQAEVIGLDLYEPSDLEVGKWCTQFPGLSYTAGDAFDLSHFDAATIDLVFGQAALHHLAHAPAKLCREVIRVLKPGGRLVFIFEPMGHNLLVAAIRAVNMARHEMEDESNLFLHQFESMLDAGFVDCEVQMFNLLGYPMKALSNRFQRLCRLIQKMDALLFERYPGLLRYGANCNLILTKSL